MRKLTCNDILMNEVISYGGIPMRRCDVYQHGLKNGRGIGYFGADYSAFAPAAIDEEPWTLEEFERLEAGDMRIPERLQIA